MSILSNEITAYEFMLSENFKMIRQSAEAQGLYAFAVDVNRDTSTTNSGTYLVITPLQDVREKLQYNGNLLNVQLDAQKNNDIGIFNPCCQIMSLDGYRSGKAFNITENALRNIKYQAFVVTAFYKHGFVDLPTVMSQKSVESLYSMWEDMNNTMNNTKLSLVSRKRYEAGYNKFVGNLYRRYMKISEERFVPVSKTQKVKSDFFVKNCVDTLVDRLNAGFREFFESEVQNYPKFFYYIDEKPALHLKDISKILAGSEYNPYSNDKEVTEWNITFPKNYEHEFYTMVQKYNLRNCRNMQPSILHVAKSADLEYYYCNIDKMKMLDSLSRIYDFRYYANIGNLEKLDKNGVQNIKIAFDKNQHEQVRRALEDILADEMRTVAVTSQDVAISKAQQNKIQHKHKMSDDLFERH